MLLFLLAALTAAPAPPTPPVTAPLAPETGDWIHIGDLPTAKLYVDTRPGPVRDGFPTMRWSFIAQPTHPSYATGFRYQRTLMAYDCSGSRWSYLEVSHHTASGAALPGRPVMLGAWAPATQGSAYKLAMAYFCDGANGRSTYEYVTVGVLTYAQLVARSAPPPVTPAALASLTRALECRTPVENLRRELSAVPVREIYISGESTLTFNALPKVFGFGTLSFPLFNRVDLTPSNTQDALWNDPDGVWIRVDANYGAVVRGAQAALKQSCRPIDEEYGDPDAEYCLIDIKNAAGSTVRRLHISPGKEREQPRYTFVSCSFF